MNLTDEQKTLVAGWVSEGASPGDVQKRLKEECGISLTYLDLRLLLDDLKVVPPEPEPPAEETPTATAKDEVLDLEPDEVQPGSGKVSVTIDQITRPGSAISGKATFSDGQKAEWYLDTLGRLGINPDTPGYRPSQKDLMAFQMELQRAAQRVGF
jgi:hypothetical protein